MRCAASRWRWRRNEAVAITGPSGCGKSTLLHLLGGLDRPTEGEVYFRGTPLSRLDIDRYRAREVGFVFQSFHLLRHPDRGRERPDPDVRDAARPPSSGPSAPSG